LKNGGIFGEEVVPGGRNVIIKTTPQFELGRTIFVGVCVHTCVRSTQRHCVMYYVCALEGYAMCNSRALYTHIHANVEGAYAKRERGRNERRTVSRIIAGFSTSSGFSRPIFLPPTL
jgi:hypothetical protein